MKTIAVVQNKPTQFDVPLYARIAGSDIFKFVVFYTEPNLHCVDSEIGRAPIWDHIGNCTYDKRLENNVVRLAKQIFREKPDLVVVSGWFPRIHAVLALLLRLTGYKVGVRSDKTLQHTNEVGLTGLSKKLLMKMWLALYSSWHPVGTLATDYLQKSSWAQRPVYLFPYNVDNDWLRANAQGYRANRDAIRRQFGIQPDEFVVLGILKWHPREDPITLVNALIHLQQDGQKNIRLILVGDGPMRDEVVDGTKRLRKKSVLPGHVPYSHLPEFFAISDVFVHPSHHEPWGVSVNEALACGLPVIVAEGVGSRFDLIENNKTGFVFPNGDSRELSRLLKYVMENGSFRSQVVEEAKRVMSAWSYDKTINELFHALDINNS